MNGASARKVVILIILGIAFLELNMSTKFGSLWALAFQGSQGEESVKPIARDATTTTGSDNPSQSATAHATTNEQNSSLQTF